MACDGWKKKLIDEFPQIEFNPFKKGRLIESNTTSLVVYVTQDSTGETFTGVVVRPDNNRSLGYCSNYFYVSEGHLYEGNDIDVKKILGL